MDACRESRRARADPRLLDGHAVAEVHLLQTSATSES